MILLVANKLPSEFNTMPFLIAYIFLYCFYINIKPHELFITF